MSARLGASSAALETAKGYFPMPHCFVDPTESDLLPLFPVAPGNWGAASEGARAWAARTGFKADPGTICVYPHADGVPAGVLVGIGSDPAPWDWAAVAARLPAGGYRIAAPLEADEAERTALGWALGGYRFDRYRAVEASEPARLAWPEGVDGDRILRLRDSIFLVRDLINTPAGAMGPAELSAAAAAVAEAFGADFREIVGDDLLSADYPSIHAVGASSPRPPRLIDIRWGAADAPRVTLVGKGVCFDTGGLDIKPAAAMKLMKKDMGGAAHVLGLARAIMAASLPVRLRVLIPAVDNAVSGGAMRPMDVVPTRKGTSIEIGHTDAEGRVVLADALAEASSESPELLVDFATLTGAARVALGPDLPALFCNDDALAAELSRQGERRGDPVWRMPLHAPYRRLIDGKTADITNAAETPYAGAITAALFLAEFVDNTIPWAHFDLMAWNLNDRPGRPEGGEAMALRAVLGAIEARFGDAA